MFGDLMRYLGLSDGMSAQMPNMGAGAAGTSGMGATSASSPGRMGTLSPEMLKLLMSTLNPPPEPVHYAPVGSAMRPTAFNYTAPQMAQPVTHKPLGY